MSPDSGPQRASTLRAVLDGELRPTLSRSIARVGANVSRAVSAIVRSGPGRVPGNVVHTSDAPDGLVVTGWAAAPRRTLRAVTVLVDGVPRAHATIDLPTPVDTDGIPLTRWSPSAGWRTEIPWTTLPAGPHEIGAVALWSDRLSDELGALAIHSPGRPSLGAVDRPGRDETVHGRILYVEGWFRTDLGYDRLEVSIDGRSIGRGQLMSRPRPDIAAFLDDADAPLAGWNLTIAIPEDVRGEVVLSTRALGPKGSRVVDERPIVLAGPGPEEVVEPERLAVLTARTDLAGSRHVPSPDGLNLLVATHHLGLGGGQLYLQELLRRIVTDHDVTCTVFSMVDGVLRDELEQLGCRVHVVGHPPVDALSYEETLLHLVAVARDTGANALVANTAGSYWGVDLASRLGIPSAWAIHESFAPDLFMHYGLHGYDAGMRERFLRAFASAGSVVFEADATRRLFQHLIPDGRAIKIDYGVDLDRIRRFRDDADRDALRAGLGIAPDEVLLLCMGTYEARKAQGLLAHAFARISPDHPRAVLALVGDQGGWYSEGIHALVDRLGLGDRIRLEPVTPHIDEWYVASDAFVLASDIESLPRSMLEAMAFGLPILHSAVWGVPEVIEDGVTGLLFEPNSVEGPEKTIRRFLRMSRANRHAIGQAARDLIEATRGSDLYAAEYRTLLGALVKDPSVLPADLMSVARGGS